MRIHTGKEEASNIYAAERLREPRERVDIAGSLSWTADNALALRDFEHRGWADFDGSAHTLWAAGYNSALGWLESTPSGRSRSPFHSDYDNSPKSNKATARGTKRETRLARVTVYWPGEGDYYTGRRMSSSGVRLREGHCAVDPKVIPYGSVVKIPGVGEDVAVDTGPAVVSRRAARSAGRTSRERNALVVDVFCSTRSKARFIETSAPKFVMITWSR